MVVRSDKIEKGLTLQFNSLQVQLSLLGEARPKRLLSHCYSFLEMLPFLDRSNNDILSALQQHFSSHHPNLDKSLPKCRLDKVDKTAQTDQTSYMPSEEVLQMSLGGKQYQMKVIFPKITFYVPSQLYEQTLRISRESIRVVVEHEFKGLDSFVEQFNKRRMENQIKSRRVNPPPGEKETACEQPA